MMNRAYGLGVVLRNFLSWRIILASDGKRSYILSDMHCRSAISRFQYCQLTDKAKPI